MHYLVRLIVDGIDKDEALSNAETFANQLVEQGEFDWYDMNGRWGKSEAFKITSKKGMGLINEGMVANRDDFNRAMKHVRYMVENYSDDEIFEEDFGTKEDIERIGELDKDIYYLDRYQFGVAGGYTNSCYIYGNDNVWGGKVDNNKDLKRILEDEGAEYIWVVGVDFHN